MPHTVLLRPVLEAILRAYPKGAIVVYGRDYTYLSVGGRGLSDVGLSAENMVGKGPVEIFGPELGSRVLDQYRRCLAGWDGTEELEFAGRTYEVTQHPVRIGFGEIVAGITITVDVTEERSWEKRRKLLEARYRAILDHFPGAIVLMDGRGQVELVAGQAVKPNGFEPVEMEGRLYTDVMAGHEPEGLESKFERALSGEDVLADVQVGDRMFQTRWRGIPDIDGDGPAVVKIAVDVTEQHHARLQIEASLAHADALLREVHHRVKNNLQVVQSLLSMTARRVDNPEARVRLLDVRDRVYAMSAVHSLLYQSDDLTAVPLHVYFRKLIHGLIKGLPDLGTVELDLRLDEVTASAEISLNLGLILTELVSNAAKHGIANGRGTVLGVGLEQGSAGLVLSVWDDGPGAPEQVLTASDHGMGLWVCRALAEPLGGRLEVAGNGGTRWTLTVDHASASA